MKGQDSPLADRQVPGFAPRTAHDLVFLDGPRRQWGLPVLRKGRAPRIGAAPSHGVAYGAFVALLRVGEETGSIIRNADG